MLKNVFSSSQEEDVEISIEAFIKINTIFHPRDIFAKTFFVQCSLENRYCKQSLNPVMAEMSRNLQLTLHSHYFPNLQISTEFFQ